MKFEHRKSEIIKGHEIVKKNQENIGSKLRYMQKATTAFCSIQTKTKACGLMKKNRNQAWQPKKVIFTVTTLERSL